MSKTVIDLIQAILEERVKEIRNSFKQSSGQKENENGERLSTILDILPEDDGIWLDDCLTNEAVLREEECKALYRAGLKDGLKLKELL